MHVYRNLELHCLSVCLSVYNDSFYIADCVTQDRVGGRVTVVKVISCL